MKNKENVVWGILLVVLGCIFGLNALGLAKINIFFEGWWTLFLIVPAIMGLIKDSEKTGDIILLLVGIFLLLVTRDIIDFEIFWKLLFPVMLVIIGVSCIFKGFTGKDIKEKFNQVKLNNEEILHVDAVFCGNNTQVENNFSGAEINAIFGGLDLGLNKIDLENDAVISATAIFGGIKLYLPEDVNVVVNSTNIFGGVTNKHLGNSKASKTIYISATCLFGGIELI